MKNLSGIYAEPTILNKGGCLEFLDFSILNSLNNDGLVLLGPDSRHLGNYGQATDKNIRHAKICAIRYFMVSRPEFAENMVHGQRYHSWYKFKDVCERENIIIPEEIHRSDDGNSIVHFNGIDPLLK